MMPIAPYPSPSKKNLTEVLGDHSHNQRRFTLMLPHFIGIRTTGMALIRPAGLFVYNCSPVPATLNCG